MRIAFEILPDGRRVPVHIMGGRNPLADEVAARRLRVMDTEDCDHAYKCQGCAAIHWTVEALLVRVIALEAQVSGLEVRV